MGGPMNPRKPPAQTTAAGEEKQRELLRRVRRIQIQTAHLIRDLFAGQYQSTFRGRGIAFSEVREYIPGDDIRSIDWNVTARMSAPYVKLFTEERELTVLIVVDRSASGRFGSGRKTKIDMSVELGAMLALSAVQNHDRAGLLIFTDRVETYVPPRKGNSHALRIIRDLLFYQPEGRGTSIRTALDFLNRVVRRRAVVFLISDFRDDNPRDVMAVTARRHDLISMRIVDPFEEKWPSMGLLELEDLETGRPVLFDTSSKASNDSLTAAYVKCQEDLTRLFRSMNADDLQFRTDQSVVQPLRRFFRSRKRRR